MQNKRFKDLTDPGMNKFFPRIWILLILGLFSFGHMSAINYSHSVPALDSLPQVFLIGEHENEYNKAISEYETLLFMACDMDMELAYSKWVAMLDAMEKYSEELDYDIKGLKVWLNIFCSGTGEIEHIAYYLKPLSKNFDTDELNAFFKSFCNQYRFPLQNVEGYSHYGTASFPVFAKVVQPEGGQGNLSNGQ